MDGRLAMNYEMGWRPAATLCALAAATLRFLAMLARAAAGRACLDGSSGWRLLHALARPGCRQPTDRHNDKTTKVQPRSE
jgi:hypothetical protein